MHASGGYREHLDGGRRDAGTRAVAAGYAFEPHLPRVAGSRPGGAGPEEPGYRHATRDSPGHGENPPEAYLRKDRDSGPLLFGFVRAQGKRVVVDAPGVGRSIGL